MGNFLPSSATTASCSSQTGLKRPFVETLWLTFWTFEMKPALTAGKPPTPLFSSLTGSSSLVLQDHPKNSLNVVIALTSPLERHHWPFTIGLSLLAFHYWLYTIGNASPIVTFPTEFGPRKVLHYWQQQHYWQLVYPIVLIYLARVWPRYYQISEKSQLC